MSSLSLQSASPCRLRQRRSIMAEMRSCRPSSLSFSVCILQSLPNSSIRRPRRRITGAALINIQHVGLFLVMLRQPPRPTEPPIPFFLKEGFQGVSDAGPSPLCLHHHLPNPPRSPFGKGGIEKNAEGRSPSARPVMTRAKRVRRGEACDSRGSLNTRAGVADASPLQRPQIP